MKDSFSKLHPAVLLAYFSVQTVFAAVCFHPVMTGISLICALLTAWFCVSGKKAFFWLAFSVINMLCFAVINPLINHQGATVLALFFGREITLQSACYGMLTGAMISAVCTWLFLMGKAVDSKKAVYLFGKGMPAITLMVFMSVRLVRRYQQKAADIFEARKGLCGDEGRPVMAKEGAASLLTYGLENGVDTADSMNARGYGCRKPTAYYDYRLTSKDLVSSAILLAVAGAVVYGIFTGACKMYFFPEFFVEAANPFIFAAYFLLCAYPLLMYLWSEIKWLYLK